MNNTRRLNSKPFLTVLSLISTLFVVATTASSQVTFTATPLAAEADVATLTWNAPGSASVEILVNSPNGTLFAGGGSTGSATTGHWATVGLAFFLVDADSKAILGQLALQEGGGNGGSWFSAQPGPMVDGVSIATVSWSAPGSTAVQIHVNSPIGPLFAQAGTTGSATTGPWAMAGMAFFFVDANTKTVLAQINLQGNGAGGPSTFTANPSRLAAGQNVAAVSWSAPSSNSVQVYLDSPTGPLFGQGGSTDSVTGSGVSAGSTFVFVDGNTQAILGEITLQSGSGPTSNSPSFTANPISLSPGENVTAVTWNVPGSTAVEVHLNLPTGQLFAEGGTTGSATTGLWAYAGLKFFFIDGNTQSVLGDITLRTADSLTASPNSLPAGLGKTTLSWNAPGSTAVSVYVDSPTGLLLFAEGGAMGRATTGDWVEAGMTFILVDATSNQVIASTTITQSTVALPNVVGLTQPAATAALTGAGLVLGTVTNQSNSTVASGNVISQNPTAGTSVNAGSAVNLVVSSGSGSVSVPNTVGLTQAAATTAISGAGLIVGTVTSQSSSTVASGNVISQIPTAGTSVNAGTAVNLVVSSGGCTAGGPPTVTLETPAAGASQLSGTACNVDTTVIKIVIYALTNQWYVQPLADAPFTGISADGSWQSATNPWSSIVVLLVNSASYTPAATEITNPALDPGVLAWTQYPPGPASVNFSGRTWGIKTTGNLPGYQFDPGPNFWSNDPSVVSVAADGLHLKITEINGVWQCGEVYLTQSLGYGTYTVQVGSPLNQLDQNTVAAPLFIYAGPNQELDNEYSGTGGLVPNPDNAQFVAQPYTVSGNIVHYVQPPTAQFTSQMVWSADHVTFTAWNGWSGTPAASDIIYQWNYQGSNIPTPGQERVHINLWLLGGNAPLGGVGDEMVINSFNFQPSTFPTTVFVPNTVGLTQSSATSAIAGVGLVVGTVTLQASSTIAVGTVISQTPAAASSANLGSAVNLVLSSGPAMVSVPNVVGLSQAAAISAITSVGLVVGTVTSQASSTIAVGTVISQTPAAASSANLGSAVNLVLASGPAMVSVPNVVGLTQAAATSVITSVGLTSGSITQQVSSTVAQGNVVSESPTAGTSVSSGSAVNLFVSAGGCISTPGGQPIVSLDTPTAGASQLSGKACNVDPAMTEVVIYVLTNQWYVQPFVDAPFTTIASDGSWQSYTHPWNSIVVLLVNPTTFVPAAIQQTNPALDSGVVASSQYP
jgi:beta-lactam-binding protein with PASTA domain